MIDENNKIAEKKDNLFDKIKNFFRKIFNKKDSEHIEENVKKDNSFITQIELKSNPEMERLLKLQEEFRDGKITQGDLSDEDIDKLGKLYDDQIEKLKIQIEDCKKRIEYKKKKLQKT